MLPTNQSQQSKIGTNFGTLPRTRSFAQWTLPHAKKSAIMPTFAYNPQTEFRLPSGRALSSCLYFKSSQLLLRQYLYIISYFPILGELERIYREIYTPEQSIQPDFVYHSTIFFLNHLVTAFLGQFLRKCVYNSLLFVSIQ